MPRPAAEPAADEKGSNSDGDGEGHERGNGADTEDGPNRCLTTEEEQCQQNADHRIEPYGIDGGLGDRVDLGPEARQGETIITGIRKRDSGCGNHTSLSHREAADNGHGKNCQSRVLG